MSGDLTGRYDHVQGIRRIVPLKTREFCTKCEQQTWATHRQIIDTVDGRRRTIQFCCDAHAEALAQKSGWGIKIEKAVPS